MHHYYATPNTPYIIFIHMVCNVELLKGPEEQDHTHIHIERNFNLAFLASY